jgi:MFS transporter
MLLDRFTESKQRFYVYSSRLFSHGSFASQPVEKMSGAMKEQKHATINKPETKPAHHEVAKKVYGIDLKEGRPQGRDVQNWLEAESKMPHTGRTVDTARGIALATGIAAENLHTEYEPGKRYKRKNEGGLGNTDKNSLSPPRFDTRRTIRADNVRGHVRAFCSGEVRFRSRRSGLCLRRLRPCDDGFPSRRGWFSGRKDQRDDSDQHWFRGDGNGHHAAGDGADEVLFFAFIALLALGMAFIAPNLSALVSMRGGGRQAGSSLGIQNAANSLGQSIGPLLGGVLFISQTNAPYLLSGATLIALAVGIAWKIVATRRAAEPNGNPYESI